MAKRTKNKMKAKAVKIIAKRRIKRKKRKNAKNQRNYSRKIYQDFRSKKNKVILPEEMQIKAKKNIYFDDEKKLNIFFIL